MTSPAAASRSTPCWGTSTTKRSQSPKKLTCPDHSVVTPDGAALLARWYRQPSDDSRAAVLYLHGDGMIVGSVATFDA